MSGSRTGGGPAYVGAMIRRALPLLLIAFLAAAAPAQAMKAKIVPKGTAYAAEVKMTVEGTVNVEKHTRLETYRRCQSGASAKYKQDVVIGGSWTAKYNQVTVPIKNEQDLGRAFKKLHVPVTPTSPGKAGFLGSFAIGGYGPQTQGDGGDSDCAQQDYFTQGTLGTDPQSKATFIDQPHKFHGQTLLFSTFLLGLPGAPVPDTFTDSLGDPYSTDRLVGNVLTDVPDQEFTVETNFHDGLADFGAFAGDFDPDDLKFLERQKVVQLSDIVRSGEADCGTETNEDHDQGCTIKWSFKFTPKFTRHFLYRTSGITVAELFRTIR